MSTIGETDFLGLWAGDALKEEKKKITALENNYNKLKGGTRYAYAHDKMIEARRRIRDIWKNVLMKNNYKPKSGGS